jgi:hypothetical protein
VAFCGESASKREEGSFFPAEAPRAIRKLSWKQAGQVAQRQNTEAGVNEGSGDGARNFEEVLARSGQLERRWFEHDVAALRAALREFEPDYLYSEFRPSACVAAHAQGVPLALGTSHFTLASFQTEPANPAYAALPGLAVEESLPAITSILEVFDWADFSFVPSLHSLEPLKRRKYQFVGSFEVTRAQELLKRQSKQTQSSRADQIAGAGSADTLAVFLDDMAAPAKTVLQAVLAAFRRSAFSVVVSAAALSRSQEERIDNIVITRRFKDRAALLAASSLCINSASYDTVTASLLYGVPQLLIPGESFEQHALSEALVALGCGSVVPLPAAGSAPGRRKTGLVADALREAVEHLVSTSSYRSTSKRESRKLLKAEGAAHIVRALEDALPHSSKQRRKS